MHALRSRSRPTRNQSVLLTRWRRVSVQPRATGACRPWDLLTLSGQLGSWGPERSRDVPCHSGGLPASERGAPSVADAIQLVQPSLAADLRRRGGLANPSPGAPAQGGEACRLVAGCP